jgi:phage recombination protein Bet
MMNDLESKVTTHALSEPVTTEYIQKYLQVMGIGKDLSPAQQYDFIERCRILQLNPFKKQIYPIVRKTQNSGTILTIVVGYEVYLDRANMSNVWGGHEAAYEGEVVYKTITNKWNKQVRIIDKEKSTLTCTIVITRKDWSAPFKHTVWLSEFGVEQEGTWADITRFMLMKVAVCQAYRMCFTECVGLPYSQEEVDTYTESQVIKAEIVEEKDKKAKANQTDRLQNQGDNKALLKVKKLQDNCIAIIKLVSDECYADFEKDGVKEKSIMKHLGIEIQEGVIWEDMVRQSNDITSLDQAFAHWKDHYSSALINSIDAKLNGQPKAVSDKVLSQVEKAGSDTVKLREIRDSIPTTIDVEESEPVQTELLDTTGLD